MRILGVDPGTLRTGVGIIESQTNRYHLVHCEIIATPKDLPIAQKLLRIYQALSEIIRQHKPDVLALEDVFYDKSLRSMVRIGEARACAMLAASGQGIDVVEYPPARIKVAVSGNGRATKEQIQHMIKTLLNLKAAPSADAADALAVAICHSHHYRSKNYVSLSCRTVG